MVTFCPICERTFKDNYLGGLRDSTTWGNNIICGRCYNKGYDNLKGFVLKTNKEIREGV